MSGHRIDNLRPPSAEAAPVAPAVEHAIATWMDLLRNDEHRDEIVEAYRTTFDRPEVAYKNHAACSVVRPRFLARSEVDALAGTSALLLRAIDKAERVILQNQRALLPRLGHFSALERRLLDIPIRLSRTDVSVRLDATATTGGWGFFELNGAIPGGLEITHDLSRMFEGSEIFKRFAGKIDTRPFNLKKAVRATLLAAWREWGGRGIPRVALVDFIDGAPLISEFRTFQRWMEKADIPCVLADPADLAIENGRLTAKGEPVDVVYRRLTIMEMLEIADTAEPLIAAAEQGLALIIDPFMLSVLDRKSMFALLSDPDVDLGLDEDERRAVNASLPYTRIVEDVETTLPNGERGALLAYIRRERENLILKPSHDFGGHGVNLGWTMTEAQWDAAIQAALSEDVIVQTRIASAEQAFPTLANPLDPVPFAMSTDPYIFNGTLRGVLCRLSGLGAISNVTAGGGVVPSFIVDD